MNDELPTDLTSDPAFDPTTDAPSSPPEAPAAPEPPVQDHPAHHELKPRLKHVSLAFMGDGWDACGIDFRALRFSDVAKFSSPETTTDGNAVLDLLKSAFIKGTGLVEDGSTVDLAAEDLDQLDIDSVTELSRQLTGVTGPNA